MELEFQRKANKAVAIWIYLGVFMLLVQVLLGGITRLTGSGLSITEWDVITGMLPPLSHEQWLQEYAKYRQTPQFHLLNFDFSLSDFQFIFFWEWFHRFWARMIAVVFVVGFVYLVARKYLRPSMQKPLLILFLMGAMQGAIGWIMVVSGLSGDAIYVKPTRLALHFIFALALIAYAFWFALQLSVPAKDRQSNKSIRQWSFSLILLVFLQLLFGALMAGHRAAPAAPTWPDINGRLLPEGLWADHPWLLNFIDNKITIHFVHRGLAYLILLLILILFFKTRSLSLPATFRKALSWPLILVLVQVVLGISAVLVSPYIRANHWGAFEWVAQLHQLTGMSLLLSLVMLYFMARGKSLTVVR